MEGFYVLDVQIATKIPEARHIKSPHLKYIKIHRNVSYGQNLGLWSQ